MDMNYKYNSIIAYYKYIKMIRYKLYGSVCHNYFLSMEMNRVKFAPKGAAILSSGNAGFYSVLNLFALNAMASLNFNGLLSLSNVTVIQYFNNVLGSFLSATTAILSLSRFGHLIKFKRFACLAIKYCTTCVILNPKPKTRKRYIVYILNYYNALTSNGILMLGKNLGSGSENIALISLANVSLSDFCMCTILLFGGNITLNLDANNTISCK